MRKNKKTKYPQSSMEELKNMEELKKNEYPQFSIERLKKEWPFSLDLADDIFYSNQFELY